MYIRRPWGRAWTCRSRKCYCATAIPARRPRRDEARRGDLARSPVLAPTGKSDGQCAPFRPASVFLHRACRTGLHSAAGVRLRDRMEQCATATVPRSVSASGPRRRSAVARRPRHSRPAAWRVASLRPSPADSDNARDDSRSLAPFHRAQGGQRIFAGNAGVRLHDTGGRFQAWRARVASAFFAVDFPRLTCSARGARSRMALQRPAPTNVRVETIAQTSSGCRPTGRLHCIYATCAVEHQSISTAMLPSNHQRGRRGRQSFRRRCGLLPLSRHFHAQRHPSQTYLSRPCRRACLTFSGPS